MEDEADHHGAADPAQAFEDLRAEVSELRRAVEVFSFTLTSITRKSVLKKLSMPALNWQMQAV